MRSEEDIFNTFNPEDYRASKTVNDITTHNTYEYDKVIRESDTIGTLSYNIYGSNLISRDVTGQKVYYLYNGHGDVTGLLSSSGAIIATYYYDAYGNIVEQSGNFSNSYRYAGYVYDEESRLYNLNARFYDASIARFMQEDTYLGNHNDPLSLNLYTYCHNNPLMYYDPTGHSSTASQNVQSAYNAYLGGYISGAEYAKYASEQLGIPIPDPSKNNSNSNSNRSSSSSGSSNSKSSSSSSSNKSTSSSSSNKSSSSSSKSSSSSSTKLSDDDYLYVARERGLSTVNSPYKDRSDINDKFE